jgi:hypothetical protein
MIMEILIAGCCVNDYFEFYRNNRNGGRSAEDDMAGKDMSEIWAAPLTGTGQMQCAMAARNPIASRCACNYMALL